MDGIIVRDVSGSNKDKYYVVFKNKRKLYQIKEGAELELVKVLSVSWRWYDNELDRYLKQGYILIEDLTKLN